MSEQMKTIAYHCPKCKQAVIAKHKLLPLLVSKTHIPCPCGKSGLTITPDNTDLLIEVPCPACGESHKVTLPMDTFAKQKGIALSCPVTGIDCFYAGEEDTVFAAMKRLEEVTDQIPEKREDGIHFLNDVVMQEVLGEIKEIASRGGISCSCGSKRFGLKLQYSSVVLNCADCGATLRIPAGSQEDIADICCRNTIQIHM